MRTTIDNSHGVVSYCYGFDLEISTPMTASQGIVTNVLSASTITSDTISDLEAPSYLTLGLSLATPNNRTLSPGSGITVLDEGPGGRLIVNAGGSGRVSMIDGIARAAVLMPVNAVLTLSPERSLVGTLTITRQSTSGFEVKSTSTSDNAMISYHWSADASTTLTAEQQKARDIPVKGALVVAPMSQTLTNYGTLGGAMAVVGTPIVLVDGVCTNGIDNSLNIVTGYLPTFTAVFRIKGTTATNASENCVTINSPVIGSTGYRGIAVATLTNFNLGIVGRANTDSGVSQDCLWHTIAITYDGTHALLLIDGVQVADSTQAPGTGGTCVNIGSTISNANVEVYRTPCQTGDLVLFDHVLTAAQLALVEAWATRRVDDAIIFSPSANNPIIYLGEQAWFGTTATGQLNEPTIVPDPADPTKLIMYFSAGTWNVSGFDIGRATASVADPTVWTPYASNPTIPHGGSNRRLDSIVRNAGVYYLYSTDGYIDLWTGTDGFNFTKSYPSILTVAGQGYVDPGSIGQLSVLHDPDTGIWHGWYMSRHSPTCEIRYCHSADGITWIKSTGAAALLNSPGTPWETYFEYHQVFKIGATYFLVGENFDGHNWTINVFSATDPTGTFTPSRKNPLLSLRPKYQTATPNLYNIGGVWYLFYQHTSLADWSAGGWNFGMARMAGTPLDLVS